MRYLGFILIISFCLGFRVFTGIRFWQITPGDNKVYVNFCERPNITFNDLPEGDPLYSSAVNFNNLTNAIFDDFNNIASSYFVFSDASTDTDYDPNIHSDRTIDVCFTDPRDPLAGGDASLETNNDFQLIGCRIRISDRFLDTAKEFSIVLTHELGHCAGLNHPQEHSLSIMSYYRESDVVRLQADDKMGITFLYPINRELARSDNTFGMQCSRK
ncbi:MAG: matrixin family metalloprotease [Bdellovibrionales bacterium]